MPGAAACQRTGALLRAGLLAGFVLAELWPSWATAQSTVRFLTAGDLYKRLIDPQIEAREAGRHYIMGVVDGLALVRDARSCIGPNTKTSDLVDAVQAQLQARPDIHRYNAASVVREAIAVQFPCV